LILKDPPKRASKIVGRRRIELRPVLRDNSSQPHWRPWCFYPTCRQNDLAGAKPCCRTSAHLCLGVALQRWLKASVQIEDGRVVPRQAGTPQGGMISPLLANLFLHYALDKWMAREPPSSAMRDLPLQNRGGAPLACDCRPRSASWFSILRR
jgi:hypothetical protein